MLNILYGAVILLISIYVFIKLKYRFWSSQPIFHTYNLLYWFYPPGILQEDIPKKNKFYNEIITCKNYPNLTRQQISLLFSFLKMHYRYLKNTTIKLKKPQFMNLFSKDSYISLQYSFVPKKLIAVLTSRQLECIISIL